MATTNKFELVGIDELIPYNRNARTHSAEQINQLRGSLREYGFVAPVVLDEKKNILCGHGRVEAARAEGYEKVPCVYANDLTEAQKKAYILADNRIALNAGWDDALLAIELTDLKAAGFDPAALGFEPAELSKLFPPDEQTAADALQNEPDDFDYSEQYGVIVMCKDEAEQKTVFDKLVGQGYTVKVVAV